MQDNRTANTLRIMLSKNLRVVIELVTSFVTRTVFIYCLSADYLGLNGLFSSILSVLSVAELGIGSAIVFHMYKPIAENDEDEIKKLVSFYKNCYFLIGLVIFGVGLCLIPALPGIVNFETDLDINLYVIYILSLVNTASTYWFYAYLQSVANAYQKQNIINNYTSLFKIATATACSLGLILTRNYYVYLVTQILLVFLQNLYIRSRILKAFPVVRNLKGCKLERQKIKRIFKDVAAIFIDRVSNTLSTTFDSLIVSAFVSTAMVGYINNYHLINNAVTGVATSIAMSAYASIGNLVSTASKEKMVQVFKKLDFINDFLLYFCCVCTCVLSTPFITLWAGKEYAISFAIVFCIVFDSYAYNMLWPTWGFKDGMGLFAKGKFLKLFRGVTNIVLSILLCKYWGAFGVYFASLITNLLITVPVFIYIVFRYGFQMSCKRQLLMVLFRLGMTAAVIFFTRFLCSLLGPVTILSFIAMMAICAVLSVLTFYLVYRRTEGWKNMTQQYLEPILRKLKAKKA